jgi:hypothetical protein
MTSAPPCNDSTGASSALIDQSRVLTNRSVSRGTEAHISDRSPRSRPGIRRSGLSMAWKEPERQTWAQSGTNARDWASQNACLIGGGYFIHGSLQTHIQIPADLGVKGSRVQISPARPRISLMCKGFCASRGAQLRADLALDDNGDDNPCASLLDRQPLPQFHAPDHCV